MEIFLESGGCLDLAEAPKLVRSVSQAMEGLAAGIRSCDDVHECQPRCVKVVAPKLEVLQTYILQIRFIALGAGDKALARQARDATYSIDNLNDMIGYSRRLQSKLPQRPKVHGNGTRNLLAALVCGSKRPSNPNRILRDVDAVNQETRRLGNLLAKGIDTWSNPLPLPLPAAAAGRGSETRQRVVFGRNKERDEIVQMLVRPCGETPHERIIPIVGPGGIGKTTLAQMVFNDATVVKHFDVRSWVSVSASSNQMELAAEILRSAQPAWGGSAEEMVDSQMLRSELCRFVTSKRFLIVLDGVWAQGNSMNGIWQDILAPPQFADTGSKILVTSRINPVPHILDASQLYAVNPLDINDCWTLLEEHALPSNAKDVYSDLTQIGWSIAQKINGLPLIAKLVGGVLGATRSKKIWMHIKETILQDNNDVSPAIRLSYNYLPVHLKRCFAYCSLFPQNWKFDSAHLIHLWIAGGFVQLQGRDEERLEDRAREYLDQLLSRSFFQEVKIGQKTYYMVHDLLHDLAKSVGAEDCFRIEDGMNCDIPSTVCHLSVTLNNLQGLADYPGLEKLRTLFIQRPLLFSSNCFQVDLAVNLKNLLMKSKNLRVLDLTGCYLEELPQCIDGLQHLRYLRIHGSIQRLPESIGKLVHLQTLCFAGKCSLGKLPAGISMLVNLRHLDVETKHTAGLVRIGRLANFQGSLELHVEKREGCTLEELRNLNGLHGLLKLKGLENVSSNDEACKAALHKKLYLKSLNLEWNPTSRNKFAPHADAKVLEGLQPHPNIKELCVTRYSGTQAPSWLRSLQQLRSLNLTNCRSLGILPPLGCLQSLRYLHMKELCAVDRIGDEFYGTDDVAFPSLNVLEFNDFPRLHEWSGVADRNSFPCLERLTIMDCPELIKIPLLVPTTNEVTIERTRLISYMRLAPVSVSSGKLQVDVCTSSVPPKILFHKQHIVSIVVLNISGTEQLVPAEQLGSLVSLQRLQLSQCDFTDQTFSRFLQALPCLSSLEITDLPNITSLPLSGPPKFCTMLTELCIRNCQLLCSLSSLRFFNSLKHVMIERCSKVTALSFPLNFGSLSSIKVLRISYCPELQSLPVGGLPSSLETLHIIECHPEFFRKSKNMEGHYIEKLSVVPNVLIR